MNIKSSAHDCDLSANRTCPFGKELAALAKRSSLISLTTLQNSPIAKRWEGLFAYLVLGYAAAFMTRGKTGADSALQGARIGFVIYAVSSLPKQKLQRCVLLDSYSSVRFLRA